MIYKKLLSFVLGNGRKREMEMLRVHVCEDNKKQRENIKTLIENIIDVENLDMQLGIVSEDPDSMLKEIQKEQLTGIFFLDIDLQHQMNGMELARRIREYQPRCFIIFVTTHSEMSYMTFSYKVEAMDFIIKDNPNDMQNRVHQCLLHAQQLYQEIFQEQSEKYIIKTNSRVQEVSYEDILFFEAMKNSRKVVLHGKKQLIEFQGTLKETEENLDDRFYRCHRACIVNKDNIVKIDEAERCIRMKGGDCCPMSVRLGKKLLK